MAAAAHRAARPLALGSGFDDDHPCPLVAASIRWSISSPAPRSFHPSACKHRHGITDWSSIAPSSTAAAASPQSSAAFTSCRSCQNHPSPKLLPRQIPIDRQTIIAFPRVPSSEAFGRRLCTGSNARDAPASETLHDTGHSGETGLIPHSPDLPRFFDAELLRSFERC